MKQLLMILVLTVFGITACSSDQQESQAESQKKDSPRPEPEQAVIDTDEDDAAIRQRLSESLGGIQPEDLRPSPIPGLYEVSKGAAIGYVSVDGKYLIEGDLLDLKTETNLTELRRNDWRQTRVAEIPEDKMIIFAPKEYDHTVTVFTDVDCGYCRKLHSQIDSYLKEGIRIRYVFYPLRGEQSASYSKAENVWCSKDRQEALTQAKQGKKVEAESCQTPINEHLMAGMELGIRGTPGIITEAGEMLPGYMPPKTLLEALEGPQAEVQEDELVNPGAG